RHDPAEHHTRPRDAPGERQCQSDADQPLEREDNHRPRGDRDAREGQCVRFTRRTLDSIVVDVGADVPDRKGDAEEESRRVRLTQIHSDTEGEECYYGRSGDAKHRALEPVDGCSDVWWRGFGLRYWNAQRKH